MKFDKALSGIDKILKATETRADENVVEAEQHRRFTDQREDHKQRIEKLELQTQ